VTGSGNNGHQPRPTLEREVLTYLEGGAASGSEVARQIRARKEDVLKALHGLERRGRVKRTRARSRGAGTGSRRLWRLAEGDSPTPVRAKGDRIRVELRLSEAEAVAAGVVPARVRATAVRALERRRARA
jgi:hypothetical protein